MNAFEPLPGVDLLDPKVLRKWYLTYDAAFVKVPSITYFKIDLQLEVTRKKGSPWRDVMVGPLAKLMKVPDPIRKWNILQTSDIPSKLPNITELDVYGPLAAVAVYEETLAIPFDSVVNSILSPFGVVAAIVAFFFGTGRYRPYGYAHTGWYFRRRTTDSKRFNIYPATNGEYQTPYMGLEERMKVLEDSSAELRELLLAEFLEVHESQTNVRNDGGANMGWAKVSDKVTEGEDQQLRAIRVENLLKG